MFKIEKNFISVPKYYLELKFLGNYKAISNIPNPDKLEKITDPSNCRDRECGDSFTRRSNISIGIVGSGLTALYATVLLKQNLLIKRIHLLDTTNSLESAIADVSILDTSPKIKYFKKNYMYDALKDVGF